MGGLVLEGPVHALVASVLGWGGWRDALGQNAQMDPPDAEPREAAGRSRGEGSAVVAADDLGEAERAEGELAALPGVLLGRTRVAIATKQVSAERIHERERVAEKPILGAELSFEVDRPGAVG